MLLNKGKILAAAASDSGRALRSQPGVGGQPKAAGRAPPSRHTKNPQQFWRAMNKPEHRQDNIQRSEASLRVRPPASAAQACVSASLRVRPPASAAPAAVSAPAQGQAASRPPAQGQAPAQAAAGPPSLLKRRRMTAATAVPPKAVPAATPPKAAAATRSAPSGSRPRWAQSVSKGSPAVAPPAAPKAPVAPKAGDAKPKRKASLGSDLDTQIGAARKEMKASRTAVEERKAVHAKPPPQPRNSWDEVPAFLFQKPLHTAARAVGQKAAVGERGAARTEATSQADPSHREGLPEGSAKAEAQDRQEKNGQPPEEVSATLRALEELSSVLGGTTGLPPEALAVGERIGTPGAAGAGEASQDLLRLEELVEEELQVDSRPGQRESSLGGRRRPEEEEEQSDGEEGHGSSWEWEEMWRSTELKWPARIPVLHL